MQVQDNFNKATKYTDLLYWESNYLWFAPLSYWFWYGMFVFVKVVKQKQFKHQPLILWVGVGVCVYVWMFVCLFVLFCFFITTLLSKLMIHSNLVCRIFKYQMHNQVSVVENKHATKTSHLKTNMQQSLVIVSVLLPQDWQMGYSHISLMIFWVYFSRKSW